MATVQRLNVDIGARVAGFNKGIKGVERSMKRLQRNMQKIGQDMTVAFTVPLVGIGTAGTRMALELEKSFGKIENLVGVSKQGVEELKRGVTEISNATAVSQNELAEAAFVVTSAGIEAGNALNVLQSAAEASAVGLGNTTEVARATVAVLNTYGEENISAAEATNVLFNTIKKGNLEAESLAPNLSKVIPLAQTLGISFAEVGANIATFTQLGASAEEATTSLSAVMSAIIAPSEGAKKAMVSLGFSADSLRKSVDENGLAQTLKLLRERTGDNVEVLGEIIPNIRALKNVLGTSGQQMDTYIDIVTELTEDTDGLNNAFENVQENGAFKFDRAVNKLKNSMISVGQTLMPIVADVADVVSSLADKFNNLTEEGQRNIVKWGAIVAAIGPAILIFSKLISVGLLVAQAVRGISTALAFLTGAISAPVAGIGALVAVGIYLGYNWEAVKDKLYNVWVAIKKFFLEGVNSVIGTVNHLLDFVGAATIQPLDTSGLVTKAEEDFMSVGDTFKAVMSDIKGLAGKALGLEFKPEVDESSVLEGVEGQTQGALTPSSGQGEEGQTGKPPTLGEGGSGESRATFLTPIIETLDLIPPKIESTKEAIRGFDEAMTMSGGIINLWGTTFSASNDALLEQLYTFKDAMNEITPTTAQVATGLASNFARMARSGTASLSDMVKATKESAKQIIKSKINEAISSQIANIMASVPFPFNLAVAAAAPAVVSALVNKAFSAFKVPAFAEGGLVTGPTLAMVGDNMSGKEAIIPFEKMGSFLSQFAPQGASQSIQVQGILTASGDELLAVIENADYNAKLYRGSGALER